MAATAMTHTTCRLIARCGSDGCNKTENLRGCSRCMVMLYCDSDGEVAHRPAHEPVCNSIVAAQMALNKAEAALRAYPGDTEGPVNLFKMSEGRFWKVWETRPYMRARLAYIVAIRQIRNGVSLRLMHDHMKDMLRLDQSDSMYIRHWIPGVLLRLGQDQECYDFLKWMQNPKVEHPTGWRPSDVFEPIEWPATRAYGMIHLSALLLLKIKLTLDLLTLHKYTKLGSKAPSVELRSSIICNAKSAIERVDQTVTILQLKGQVDVLVRSIRNSNVHFWPALLEPHKYGKPFWGNGPAGSIGEMEYAVLRMADAWHETPLAVGWVMKILSEGGYPLGRSVQQGSH